MARRFSCFQLFWGRPRRLACSLRFRLAAPRKQLDQLNTTIPSAQTSMPFHLIVTIYLCTQQFRQCHCHCHLGILFVNIFQFTWPASEVERGFGIKPASVKALRKIDLQKLCFLSSALHKMFNMTNLKLVIFVLSELVLRH